MSEQSDEEAEPPAPDAVASPWSDSLADLVADMRLEHEERRAPPSPSPYSPFQLGDHMVGWPGSDSTDVGSTHASPVAGASSGATGQREPVVTNWYRGMQCRSCRLPMQHRGVVVQGFVIHDRMVCRATLDCFAACDGRADSGAPHSRGVGVATGGGHPPPHQACRAGG